MYILYIDIQQISCSAQTGAAFALAGLMLSFLGTATTIYSLYIQCIYSIQYVYIQCIYTVYIYSVYTVYSMYIYSVYIQCIYSLVGFDPPPLVV